MRRIARAGLQCVLILLVCSFSSLAQEPELVVQTKHVGFIQSVAFSHDGKILAAGGSDGRVKLWDVDAARQILTINAHPGVPFAADSKPHWTTSKDMAVNFFERFDGGGWANMVHSLCFSPDGKYLASGSSDKTIKLWDLNDVRSLKEGKAKVIETPSRVWQIVFSKDGSRLLSVGEDDDNYRYWDVATLKEVTKYAPPPGFFRLPWESQNGNLTAEYSEKRKTIKMVDSATRQTKILDGHEAGVRRAVFSPNGEIIASCGWDRTVRLWEPAVENAGVVLGEHGSFVSNLAFSPDGKTLASVGGDLVIKLWNVERKGEPKTLSGYGSYIEPLLLVRDDEILVTKSDDVLNVWDIKKGRKLPDLGGHRGRVNLVAYSYNKEMVATTDGIALMIQQFVVAVARQLKDVRVHKLPDGVVLTPDDFILIKSPDYYGSFDRLFIPDNNVKLWRLEAGEPQIFSGPTEELTALTVGNEGDFLAGGDKGGTIWLWEIAGENKKKATTGHLNQPVTSIAISFDSRKLASVDESGVLRVWRLVNGKSLDLIPALPPIKLKFSQALWAEFSTDNQELLLFGRDNQGKLISSSYNASTGRIIPDAKRQQSDKTFEVSRAQQAVSNLFHKAASSDQKFVFEFLESGKLGLFAGEDHKLIAALISFNEKDWAIVTPDGLFDTNKLEKPDGLHWVFPDAPLKTLSFEIFMRDYYEPRLLPRLLKCNLQNNCKQEFKQIPPLTELNRNQPKVEKITVLPKTDGSDLVDVKVKFSSVAGQCFRSGKYIPCESGVYDLRLYRDGQIVGQSPSPDAGIAADTPGQQTRQEFVRQWREESVVKTAGDQPVSAATGAQEVIFKNIRVPRRADVGQVAFTAYAFNEDRVKSEIGEPAVYTLPKPRPTDARRRAYIVTVGVDATSDRNLRLLFAPNGARDIEQLLKGKLQSKYEVVPVQLISEFQESGLGFKQNLATKSNIRTVLSILSGLEVKETERRQIPNQENLQAATPDDLVILYIASHGYRDWNGKFYIMPSDLEVSTGGIGPLLNCLTNAEQSLKCQEDPLKAVPSLLQHSVSSEELAQWLQMIDAGEMALILDSCHSASVSGPNFKPGPMGDRGFGQLSYDKGMRVLAATQAASLAVGGLPWGDRSLLAVALTQKENNAHSFDIESWLSEAEKTVPKLYKEHFPEEEEQRQEPLFFNFTKK